jgi:hypothetical protein
MVPLRILRMGTTAASVLAALSPAFFLSCLYEASGFVSGVVAVKFFMLQWAEWGVLGL